MAEFQPGSDSQRIGKRLELHRVLRPFLSTTFGFSLVANLLLLVSPIYMLQVYDRVVTSGSYDALIWLTVIALFLLAVYGVAEAGRRRTLALASQALEDQISAKAFAAFEKTPDHGDALGRNLSHMRRVIQMFSNGSLLPFIDLPFTPLFLLCLFLIHPLIGIIGLAGAALIFAIACLAELSTRDAGKMSGALDTASNEFAGGLARQRSAIVAMGLRPAAFKRWRALRDSANASALAAGKGDNLFAALSRASRQSLQIAVLGAGAALALSQSISLGAIVAGSIIMARALAPIDQIVGGWRTAIRAHQSYRELSEVLTTEADDSEGLTSLPRPKAELAMRRLAIAAPGAEAPLVRPFTFEAGAGDVIALMGANGAGKTSLLQTLVGAWPAFDGTVELGGRSIHQWASADRGQHVGYIPQDVEILPGTVRENIARFTDARDEDVFAAAKRAAAHDMIVALSDGYDTRVGPGGRALSAGQRQLLGLARGLFGDPVLLVLDEPTANLDSEAVMAFLEAVGDASQRGAIVVAATHDARFLARAKTVLFIRAGSVVAADAARYLESAAERSRKDQAG